VSRLAIVIGSQIEGERISRIDIRSSIMRALGIKGSNKLSIHDRRAEGIAQMITNARSTFQEPLTEAQLWDWHLMLFSGTRNPNLIIGAWRAGDDPMQVVSGHDGRLVVHYEAPPSSIVPKEMKRFIRWFNQSTSGKPQADQHPVIRAAIAHLYFESIHPFEDGNGRIGRVIAEKALSQGMKYPVLLSLSQVIDADKKAYYAALKNASRSNEITKWIEYFISVVSDAETETQAKINFVMKKRDYFDRYGPQFNDRQLKVIKRMMKEGLEGFEGGMSAKKYMTIADTSKATATRDLHELVSINALTVHGKGRSVRYELNWGHMKVTN